MPHKVNAARRHKFAKQKYRVTNWTAYNESLRQRGDLTIWISDEVHCLWSASRRRSRGGQPKYSDLAIKLCLTLRVVYGLPLRQTQGLMRSVAALMGLDISVPTFRRCRVEPKVWCCRQQSVNPGTEIRSIWWSTVPV